MEVLPRTLAYRGCELAYDVQGHGPPVLFIQGVGVHGGGWRPQVDALAGHYRCLTFDNRGLHRSQPLGASLTVEQMADDALALLDAECWDSAHLVGHSLGGLIAIAIALRARKRVRSLALLCTFARGKDATGLSPWLLWNGLCTRVGTRRQRRRAFLKFVLPPQRWARPDLDKLAEELAPLFGHDLADQPPVVNRQLAAMRQYDAGSRLGELAGMPTLVVSARHDRIARPEFGRSLAGAIPGARYVEFADAAHGLPIEQAMAINEMLLDHLHSSAAKSGLNLNDSRF